MVNEASLRAVDANCTLDDRIHVGDPGKDLRANLVGGQAARRGLLGGLSPVWQVTAANHDRRLNDVPEIWPAGNGPPRREATFKALGGAGVGEVEMFEDLRDAPLSIRMPQEVGVLRASDGGTDVILESLQVEIHFGAEGFI